MQWYEKLGYAKYPLDPRSNPNLVGVSAVESKMIQYMLQGNMCLLSGFTGSGKTSMLRRLSKKEDLKQFKFVFISADGIKKNYHIDDAIKDSRSFVEMITFKKPRNLIVMLDESHLANRYLTESIKSKWNVTYPTGEKMIQSVIVSQIEPALGTNFSGSFIDRLGHRIIQMPRLEPEEIVQVLRNRLKHSDGNYANRFNEEGITFLAKSSDGSVRQLLEYTDTIFRRLCEMDSDPLNEKDFEITKEIVFNLLQEAGLAVYDENARGEKSKFTQILDVKRLKNAVEMFEQFGAMSSVLLAEKLDQTKTNAQKLIRELEQDDALMYSHTDAGEKVYVLTPGLRHALVKE